MSINAGQEPDPEHVHTDACRPRARDVVLLDRITPGGRPSYRVVAETRCVRCSAPLWLGTSTCAAVAAGLADPLCLECAPEVLGPAPAVTPIRRLPDAPARPWLN